MEHLGKSCKDFSVVGSDYVDIYSLQVGDYFMQDTYPEVYIVTGAKQGESGLKMVVAHDLTCDEPDTHWGYSNSAYAPCVVKLVPKKS